MAVISFRRIHILLLMLFLVMACSPKQETIPSKISVIFDTDANNELDDQHALAYLLFNQDTFSIKAVTTNATYNGGEINKHVLEADRIIKLCNAQNQFPLLIGANSDFETIKDHINNSKFDGYASVEKIISEAKKVTPQNPLVVLAVGKLTNVALAVFKEPSITKNIRLVWLGSNYPEPGEYNLENDIPAMNLLLDTDIPFEMVTVRYGKPSGTDAVKIYKDEVHQLKGLGPQTEIAVEGRHGLKHHNFGDYALSLFDHANYYGNPPARSLFDMAAVAIVKNPNWAINKEIPAPIMKDGIWVERPNNDRKITLWEHFDKENIMSDFYKSLKKY